MVAGYLRFMTAPGPGDFRALKGGRRLNEILLGAFGSELDRGIRKIIVVPDGELIDLPFEALVGGDGRYLAERFEFSYVHSASTLIMLQDRRRRRTGEDLLAVGVSQPPRPASSVFQFAPQFSELRHVAVEVRAAERASTWGKRHVLLDAQADEGALKRLDWRAYRIIHFAVHGIHDADHWTRSSCRCGRTGRAKRTATFRSGTSSPSAWPRTSSSCQPARRPRPAFTRVRA